LRRTAIKDLAAYCGFLIGFLGSAPFAWQRLAEQLEVGNFSRGLWYFLLFVSAAGVFAGIAGLGTGFVLGWLWEQFHRRRRRKRLKSATTSDVVAETPGIDTTIEKVAFEKQPRLRLVPMERAPASHVVGNRLAAVRFLAETIELDFSGVVIETEGQPVVSTGSARYRYPEDGSRDALCRLIGTTVRRMRVAQSNELQLTFDDGSELVLFPRLPPRGT
jgi:Family of unknown function (DUF6188)